LVLEDTDHTPSFGGVFLFLASLENTNCTNLCELDEKERRSLLKDLLVIATQLKITRGLKSFQVDVF